MFDENSTAEEILKFMRWDSERLFYYKSHGNIGSTKFPPHAPTLPEKFLNDRDFMKQAVQICGDALMQASDELKNDKELILLAAPNCRVYDFKINEELYSDRDFVLQLVSVNGELLRYVNNPDREVILAAVRNTWEAASHIDRDLLCDREFVKEMVKLQGRTLRYVPYEFRDDEEIVLLAVGSYRAFEFASGRLRCDDGFLKKALEVNPSCLAYAPASYREDRELVLRLMDRHPYVYRYAKGEIKKDLDIALLLLKKDVSLFYLLDYPLKKSDGVIAELQRQLADESTSDKNKEYIKECLDWIKTVKKYGSN